MPSVGDRRSRRVFVSNAAAKPHGAAARAVKRLAASEKRPEGDRANWRRVFGGAGDASGDLRWRKGDREKRNSGMSIARWNQPVLPEYEPSETARRTEPVGRKEHSDSLKVKMFGITYNRKRRRLRFDDSLASTLSKERKVGIVYTRKRKRPKRKPEVGMRLKSLVAEPPSDSGTEDRERRDVRGRAKTSHRELEIVKLSKNIAGMVGILESDLCTAPGAPLVLVVLVDSSCNGSSDLFMHILISILRSTRRARVRFLDFTSFLFSELLAGVFSLHGIHFLPIRLSSIDAFSRDARIGCGLCKIYGAEQFVPLLTFDFSALPFYFKALHMSMVRGSWYLSGVLIQGLIGLHSNAAVVAPSEASNSHVPQELGLSEAAVASSLNLYVMAYLSSNIAEGTEVVARETVTEDLLGFQKHRRKRSSLRRDKSYNPSSSDSQAGYSPNSLEEPVHVKHRNSSRKNSINTMRDLKVALAEVKQKIDSVRCDVNILVSESDRCWREEGYEVMLDHIDSKGWCIAVKAGGTVRFLHKPQDMRPCVVNRFTHSYMWAGEDGWKLEFCDKWDWYVFKELHRECCERNMDDVQDAPVIPIPGVREVSGHAEIAVSSFTRPDSYIHMMHDEVGRILAGEMVNYDMDSGDEEFLENLNSSSFDAENNGFERISEDNFEKIVFGFEKDVYNSPGNTFNKEKALNLCQGLGTRDMAIIIYNYWLGKRNKRHTSLVKAFQDPPSRKEDLTQKPYLRKKRSLPREHSVQNPYFLKKRSLPRQQSMPQVHVGRGKQGFFLQALEAKHMAMRRVREAESAAKKAMEPAILLRTRAQKLMAMAELATYKAVSALKIAEAKLISESPDICSSILD